MLLLTTTTRTGTIPFPFPVPVTTAIAATISLHRRTFPSSPVGIPLLPIVIRRRRAVPPFRDHLLNQFLLFFLYMHSLLIIRFRSHLVFLVLFRLLLFLVLFVFLLGSCGGRCRLGRCIVTGLLAGRISFRAGAGVCRLCRSLLVLPAAATFLALLTPPLDLYVLRAGTVARLGRIRRAGTAAALVLLFRLAHLGSEFLLLRHYQAPMYTLH